MIISTHTITEEYCDSILVIYVLETDRGGTKFSTVSAAQEIVAAPSHLMLKKREKEKRKNDG